MGLFAKTIMMIQYQPPWYLSNGLVQTLAGEFWYGRAWKRRGDRAPWLSHLPPVPWRSHIFTGAEGVPLWGLWSCPANAKATIIFNTGLNGVVRRAWYAHLFARKACDRGFAVLLYDWRGHGQSAELSPVPFSCGWREGEDQVHLAAQLVKMGCPAPVIFAGVSMGGQLALWGLKAAIEKGCSLVGGAATLSTNLESNRCLANLRKKRVGRAIERHFVRDLRAEVKKQCFIFPDALDLQVVRRIKSIDSYDREIAIGYYGFASVAEYYRQTSALYFLDELTLPHLILYSKDDPMFVPDLVPEIKRRTSSNPHSRFVLTDKGGHVSYIGRQTREEDRFWGINRLLEFCETILDA